MTLEELESRLTPAQTAFGAAAGSVPLVTVLNSSGAVVRTFNAYDTSFLGGVNVATGDVTGDGVSDIVTAIAAGGGPHVKVFDGVTFAEVRSFYAYDASFTGGVTIATVDTNGDGASDIVTGVASGGSPHVKVFDGRTLAVLHSFYAYDAAFTGGVNVAVGDLNGDLLPDIITGSGSGGGPNVRVFNGRTAELVSSFYAYDPAFSGGVNVGSGDVDSNGTDDLITGAGPGGGPHVRVWTGGPNPTVIGSFMALDGVGGGVRVGSIAGEGGDADRIAATSQSTATSLQMYNLGGDSLGSAGSGLTTASATARPDLLIRYHTLSQVGASGGAGHLESLGSDKFKLTVKGVTASMQVQWFDDAPGRGTGQESVEAFINQIWPRQYGAQGANAVIEMLVGSELIGQIFFLTNPELNLTLGTLTFDALSIDAIAGTERSLDIDRLILGLSPSDVTNKGGSIPAVNRGSVHSYAVAAVGGTLTGNGTAGTLTLTTPLDPSAQFSGSPSKQTSLQTVSDFVSEFTTRFGANTPNAAVMFQDGTGALHTVTLDLASGHMSGGNAVFDVAYTGQPYSGSLSLPLLFVDQATIDTPTPSGKVAMDPTVFGDLSQVVFSNSTMVALNKVLTITNNSSNQTLYPFLMDVNDGYYLGNIAGNWAYDIQDKNGQEYRAYIGYYDKDDGKYYYGLLPGKTITINVPLVFWDGARIAVATDPNFLKNELAVGDANINNPTQYYAFEGRNSDNQPIDPTLRYIDTDPLRVGGNNGEGAGDKPVIMYYRSKKPQALVSEAPDQLVEFTIRDPIQAQLNGNLPDPSVSQYLGPLFNYDESFVDSLMLPVALQATDIPTGSGLSYGWVGAAQDVSAFQEALKNFTSGNTTLNGLGQYFDGQGWNKFFFPDAGNMGIKLPATKNIYELSPFNLGISSYATGQGNSVQYHILASGGAFYSRATLGTGEIKKDEFVIQNVNPEVIKQLAVGMLTKNEAFFDTGTAIAELGPNWIRLNAPATQDWVTGNSITFDGSQYRDNTGSVSGSTLTITDKSILHNLKAGMLVTADTAGLQNVTRILSVDETLGTITLDKTGTGSGKYTFSGAISDYVSEKLISLWYGWADFYKAYVASLNPPTGAIDGGNVTLNERTLTYASADTIKDLKVGMVVDGLGIGSSSDPTKVTTISKIVGNVIYLSKVATESHTSASYTFSLPREIKRSPGVNPLTLDFSAASPEEQQKAHKFAEVLYSVMDAFSTIPPQKDRSYTLSLMQNITGGNVSKVPGIGVDKTAVRVELEVQFRDQSKSIERGVYDFTVVKESSNQWYPDPSVPTADAKVNGTAANFNLYNLDPYVWFVHRYLGVSGYAFSLDDDSADVGAKDSNTLKITIGGLDGLPNKAGWTIGAPYGPVGGSGTAVKNADPNVKDRITGLSPDVIKKLGNPSKGEGQLGALVIGPGIQPGTRVDQLEGADTIILDTKLGDIGTQPATYMFFGPVYLTGTIDQANPKRISNLDPDVIGVLNAITINSTLLPGSLSIIGPGISETPQETQILNINTAGRYIELSQNVQATLANGSYRFKIT